MQFDVGRDIETIHKACKGLGTDEKALLSVVCNRPKEYLQFLRQEYPKHHKVDLISLCEKELSGNLERVVVASLSTDAENRARFLHEAIEGAGTDDQCLVDVICTSLPSQIRAIREVFKKRYGDKFDKAVKADTSGNFQDVLKAVMNDKRPEAGVDAAFMAQDMDVFYKATEGKIGTDEKAICDIIKVRSREHLWAFNEAYRQRSKKGKTAIEVLQSETSGILELAFCAVFMQPASWYARAIHLAMKGAGTNEKRLIRNVMLGLPFEVKLAAGVMQTFYKEDMIKRIKEELSGDFERALVAYVEFALRS